ncbi:MAG: hypothetical protein QF441_02990 [Bacteriovoracaceae bacterium]|jgi:hypothetical protein|nr:hypothetical protein [Bacteriovoracaceae bacterium]
MDEIYFLVRFTPFWSIPIFLIAAEMTYIFWIRKKKRLIIFCATVSIISFCCTVGYYVAGGPEKSVESLMQLVWYFTR